MENAGLDDPMIKDTFAWTLIVNNQIERGLHLIDDALSKMDFPDAHYHRAEGLLKRQPPNTEDAKIELTKAQLLIQNDELQGKTVDSVLKSHILEELDKISKGISG